MCIQNAVFYTRPSRGEERRVTLIPPLDRLEASRLETPAILRRLAATSRQLAATSRQLAELKGVAGTIPHQGILIDTLGLREAKDTDRKVTVADRSSPVRR